MEEKFLIIFAHPSKDSHAGYTLSKFIEFFKEKKYKFNVIDLYKLKFNPVLKHEELKLNSKKVEPQIEKFQKLITDSKHLIIIYPTWWQNVPAILKGFIDRVFTKGFAFKYVGNMPKGLLQGRNAVVLTSTGGPKLYNQFIKKNRSLKVVTKDTLEFCGIRTRGYLVGSATNLDEKQKKKIDQNIKEALRFLF